MMGGLSSVRRSVWSQLTGKRSYAVGNRLEGKGHLFFIANKTLSFWGPNLLIFRDFSRFLFVLTTALQVVRQGFYSFQILIVLRD
jgi:hypothetical protein